MSENGNLEHLTYKELVRELIKRMDSQDAQIRSIDEREIVLQKIFEKMLGVIEGKRIAKAENRADWKLVLTVIGVAASIVLGLAGLIW